MCIGVPMRIVAVEGPVGLCEGRGRSERINLLLVDDAQPGSWVLSFLGTARRLLTEDEAREIDRAIDGLEAAFRGDGDLDGFFSDLTSGEPTLPVHLRGDAK
jgi:hydrogenase assembly chaperone HypC/HupF